MLLDDVARLRQAEAGAGVLRRVEGLKGTLKDLGAHARTLVGDDELGEAVACDFRCDRARSVRLLEDAADELSAAISALGHTVTGIRHSVIRSEVAAAAPRRPISGRIDTVA